MNYYAAVVSESEIAAPTLYPPYNILASYHYFKKYPEVLKECMLKQFNVFIDSGAFSAMTKNVDIDIDDYCNFIKKTGAIHYASLDVIGNAKKTMENHLYMVNEHGLKPIPTFHMGSTLEELFPVIEASNYIALGGLVFSPNVMKHCDEVWSYILREKPKLKVHGFGLTNIELMERYPWHSVDSSSYKSCRRFGRQNILWNGFKFTTLLEEEFRELLRKQHIPIDDLTNKQKYFIYDMHSAQSYKLYAEHLKVINKTKDFSYLTDQFKLFD